MSKKTFGPTVKQYSNRFKFHYIYNIIQLPDWVLYKPFWPPLDITQKIQF